MSNERYLWKERVSSSVGQERRIFRDGSDNFNNDQILIYKLKKVTTSEKSDQSFYLQLDAVFIVWSHYQYISQFIDISGESVCVLIAFSTDQFRIDL